MAEQTAPPRPTSARRPAEARADRSRRARPPRALVLLLVASLLAGVTWSLVTPAFQAPDENAHYAFVQSLVEGPGLPGNPGRPLLSTEQADAAAASNADQTAAIPQTKPTWDPRLDAQWRAADRRLARKERADGGGPLAAANNPPLYYAYAAVPYAIARGDSLMARLLAVRWGSVLWLLVTVLGAWLLVGEVLGRDRLLQLAGASVAALAPMSTFMAASVSPDAMLYALWALAAWLGVRILKRRLPLIDAVALGAVVGAACVVKATSYALLPAATLAIGLGAWRRYRLSGARAPVAGRALAGAAGVAVTLGTWLVVARVIDRPAAAQVAGAVGSAGTNWRELASYLWQFYLPRLPFMQDFFHTAGVNYPVYDVFLQGSWGRFGWLEVKLPGAVYLLATAATIGVAVAAAVRLWRDRGRHDLAVGAFLVLVVLTLLAGLHWTDFHLSAGGSFMQGRYLLPLLAIAGLTLAQALRLLSPRRRVWGVAVVLAALFALQALSLGTMLERFYA
jgi:4-amino-4-deoxy-L-arabinose transferase-like glycosyltransferase